MQWQIEVLAALFQPPSFGEYLLVIRINRNKVSIKNIREIRSELTFWFYVCL